MNSDKKLNRERNIREQAKQLIKANGFYNTSMQQIASNCGLAVGTLYNYFPSKNDILISLVMEEITYVLECGESIVRGLSCEPQDCFNALLKEYSQIFTFFSKELWINFLADVAIKIDAVNVEGYLWKGFEQLRDQIEKTIVLMKEHGDIRLDIEEKTLSMLLFNMFYIHFREYIYSTYSVDTVLENLEKQVGIVVFGIKNR